MRNGLRAVFFWIALTMMFRSSSCPLFAILRSHAHITNIRRMNSAISATQFQGKSWLPVFSAALAASCFALSLSIPVASAQSDRPATPTLTDAELVWDTRALDVAEARRIVGESGRLAGYVDRVIDRAGRYSVNPRLIVLLAEESATLGSLDGLDSTAANERLDHFIGALSHMFETGRSRHEGGLVRTRARAQALADQSYGARALAATFLAGDVEARELTGRWRSRYGPKAQTVVDIEMDKAAPALFLRLPWLAGQAGWSFNGVHTTSGGCNPTPCASPQSSIDFSRGWPTWGTSTITAPVHAAHGGTVTVFSSCNVRVTNVNGWATNYYHLANVAVANGATVVTGQRLADYADNSAQALCQGGSSTGPHTHVTLLASGAQVAIDQSEFSGWRINAATVTRDYDSDCGRMNLTRDGFTACAYVGSSPTSWAMHTLPTGHPSSKLCDLDIDGSGTVEPDRDGVLLLRYLFGLRGNALIAGINQTGAARTLPATIEGYIASKDYDLDRSGATLTLHDGAIAQRAMMGVTSSAVASGLGPLGTLLNGAAGVAAYVAGCR